jgi:hypothetical protein
MPDDSELVGHVREIRKLLELLAEPAIAQRDAKLREALRQIAGRSKLKQNSVLLMNGKRRQKDIQVGTGIDKGTLSALVARLSDARLLTGDLKLPMLAISLPRNFFEVHAKD